MSEDMNFPVQRYFYPRSSETFHVVSASKKNLGGVSQSVYYVGIDRPERIVPDL